MAAKRTEREGTVFTSMRLLSVCCMARADRWCRSGMDDVYLCAKCDRVCLVFAA